MKFLLLLFLFINSVNLFALSQYDSSKVCQKCHPIIYKEHYSSSHRNASIYNDAVHKAVWDKHPFKKQGKYKCAKCHTPSDKELISSLKRGEEALPQKNSAQLELGVSCLSCHMIKSVNKHAKSNENVMTDIKDRLYSAREGEESNHNKSFKLKSSMFGLVTTESGSPFHDIDFSNKNFYNGNVCIGCHSHKQNSNKLQVCSMDLEKHQNSEKENCITCHMPKVKGSFTTLKESKTHRYHGFLGTNHKPKLLAKYVKITFDKQKNGFDINIQNMANHPLLSHPLRLGELRVSVVNNGKKSELKSVNFIRVIGHDSKPTPPWLATKVLKDTQIQAKESRKIHFNRVLKHGDIVEVSLGQYIVNPKMAKKLGINDKKLTSFKLFKKERFSVK